MTTKNDAHEFMRKILHSDEDTVIIPSVLFRIRPEITTPDGRTQTIKLKTAAFTLAALLHQCFIQQACELHDGWIVFSSKIAEEETGFKEKTQYNHVQLLLSCGLIQEPQRSSDVLGRRVLKINMWKLYDLVKDAKNRVDSE